jgi:hypothetical protein
VTLAASAALAGVLVAAGLQDRFADVLGGWNGYAAAFAVLDGLLNLFGAVWLLGVAQRRLDRPLRAVGPRVRRSAYGAFVVQTAVLLALAAALRPLGAPAEVKALLVASAGVVASFGLAWLLVRWVPGVARVL